MIKPLLLLLYFSCFFCYSQNKDTLIVIQDSVVVDEDSLDIEASVHKITNEKAIYKSLAALRDLEMKKSKKWRVLHIGDSHIQADVLTSYIRQNLQNKFGNGGLGFAFPYKMAKTNGASYTKFSSKTTFESYRNIKPLDSMPVGLSGIALFTDKNDFLIELKVQDIYKFNTIKVVTPQNQNSIWISSTSDFSLVKDSAPLSNELHKESPKVNMGYTTKKISTIKIHKIKKGQVLSTIADKYHVTVSQIKKANHLKSDHIQYGNILKIPTIVYKKVPITNTQSKTIATTVIDTIAKEVETKKYVPLSQTTSPASHDFYSEKALSELYLIPNAEYKKFALNGIVLENDQPGVVYSAIGVNGAKCSDFNKYEAFFHQIQALEPQLIVISFGTNESFDKLENDIFIEQLNELIETIRLFSNNVEILVTTPQPSQFNRRNKNQYVSQYAESIIDQAAIKNYAVWDIYKSLGGASRVNSNFKNGIITADKIHYTHKGYKKQADDFFEALMQLYESYKSTY